MKPVTGRHVLIAMVSFFGVIFAVNGLFLYFAVSGFPGLDTEDGYRKGLDYNRQIAAARAFREKGWRIDLSLDDKRNIQVMFADREGAGLAMRKVEMTLAHPASARADMAVALRNPSPGRFVSVSPPEARGNWTVKIAATGPDARPIELRKKIWLP